MGRLERHLDIDLIAKIENGWKPQHEVKPMTRQKEPRRADTYRSARRNAPKSAGQPSVWNKNWYWRRQT